jgi:hypothetical protein
VNTLRRRLIALVFTVMACQLADIVAAPLVICRMGTAPSAGSGEISCTCPQGPDAECPMHKHEKPIPSSRETRWCADCRGSAEMILTTLIGFAGPVVERHQTLIPEGASEPLITTLAGSPDLSSPPSAPPPRG